MKVTADTNVLVRAIVWDDEAQASRAADMLQQATAVVISLQALCELVWVLHSRYGVSRADIGSTLRKLLDTENVIANRPAADAGLDSFDAGGDFADGVIAYEGAWLGAETFVSFDKKAVSVLAGQGKAAKLL